MGKPRIDEIEQAIIDAIEADAALNYLRTKETLGERAVDFRREQFILVPPAVLVFYSGGSYADETVQGTLYQHVGTFVLVAAARNLRGAAAAKRGTTTEKGVYDILDDLRNLFAGKKLSLPSLGNKNQPICLLRADGFEAAQPGLMVYSLELEVRSNWDNLS